jgi:hypothetical protein
MVLPNHYQGNAIQITMLVTTVAVVDLITVHKSFLIYLYFLYTDVCKPSEHLSVFGT